MSENSPADKVFEMMQGGAGTLKGKIKWVVLLFVLLFVLPLVRGMLFTWKVIEPGYTGIKINRLVNRGVTREDIVTGFIFYNPIQSAVVIYPTFIQRVAWTHDKGEGKPVNEELTFNTKDSVPVNLDVAVSSNWSQPGSPISTPSSGRTTSIPSPTASCATRPATSSPTSAPGTASTRSTGRKRRSSSSGSGRS